VRAFQSVYFGNDAGQVEQAGCVSYTATISSGWGYGSGRSNTPLKILNTAVVTPMPSAKATIASAETKRERTSVRTATFRSRKRRDMPA